MGKGLKQIFLQRRYINSQQTYEKMLSIINYQRKISQNHNEIALHICLKKKGKISIGKDVETLEHLNTYALLVGL